MALYWPSANAYNIYIVVLLCIYFASNCLKYELSIKPQRLMMFLCVRFKEADRRTSGSDRVEALGGDTPGRLQAGPRTRGDQTAATPR